MPEPMNGPPTFGPPRYFVTGGIPVSKIGVSDSPRLIGRYAPGAGPAQEISLSTPFAVTGGVFSAQAAAQYELLGRSAAGAGAMSSVSRTAMNIAGTDLANNFTLTQTVTVTTGNTILCQGDNTQGSFVVARFQSNSGGAGLNFRKARGTVAAPLIALTNDVVGTSNYSFWDGVSAFISGATITSTLIDTTPATGAAGSRLTFNACPIGSATLTEIMRLQATGWSAYGANVVLDSNRLFKLRPFTFATLPAVAVSLDGRASIADGAAAPAYLGAAAGGGTVRTPVYCNAAAWVND